MLRNNPVELIGINVSNFETSLIFYRDTLGLEAAWINDEKSTAAFNAGNLYLLIRENPREASSGGARIYFTVERIRSMRSRLHDSGVSVSALINDAQGESFDFSDPDGNRLGLFEPSKD